MWSDLLYFLLEVTFFCCRVNKWGNQDSTYRFWLSMFYFLRVLQGLDTTELLWTQSWWVCWRTSFSLFWTVQSRIFWPGNWSWWVYLKVWDLGGECQRNEGTLMRMQVGKQYTFYASDPGHDSLLLWRHHYPCIKTADKCHFCFVRRSLRAA